MRKDQVKLGNVRGIPDVIFAATFDNHMKLGDRNGSTHSGLHLLGEFSKQGPALRFSDVTADNSVTGTLNGRATTVTFVSADKRAKTFIADVNVYGTAKRSSFFPLGTTLDAAKGFIRAAWKDHCTYGTSTYGGGDVDIYSQMRRKFALNWVGMARIGSSDVWIGCAHSGSVVTAFPAVKNKFAK